VLYSTKVLKKNFFTLCAREERQERQERQEHPG